MSILTVKKEDKWYLCNDTKISQIEWDDYATFISQNAFLVFYNLGTTEPELPEELKLGTQIRTAPFPKIAPKDVVHGITAETLKFQ